MKKTKLLIARCLTLLIFALLSTNLAWGAEITFDPTKDKTFPKDGITISVTDGTLTNGTDYRVYKNQTMTISSTVGNITKIEFTYSSASYDGGGWASTYSPNAASWTSPTANGEQARITQIKVTTTGSSKTLKSIAISGTPNKTTYDAGDSFDPAGLTVTGTYDDSSTGDVTSSAEWTFDPDPLTAGTTSVSVTAKVSDITSEAYQVNGLTVKEFVQTYANTYTSDASLSSVITGSKVKWEGCKVTDGYAALKMAKGGTANITVPAGTKTVHLHMVAWKDESANVTVKLGSTTLSSIKPTADDGVAGTTTTYTIAKEPNIKDSYYFAIDVNADEATTLTLTTGSSKRAILFGVNFEADKTLESIAISGTPTKKEYEVGETFDPAGLVVTGTYDDKTTEEITEGITWTFDPETFTSTSTTSVDVLAGVGSVTSDIFTVTGLTVKEALVLQSIAVSGEPTKKTYNIGEAFDPAGLVVTGTYNDESQKTITDGIEWLIDPETFTTAGTVSVDVMASVGEISSEVFTVTGLTVLSAPKELVIDFENNAPTYTDWTFTNMTSKQTGDITAHGGDNYGTTGGKTTAVLTTKQKIGKPQNLTFYVSKTTANTTTSTWEIQVSEDNNNWTDVTSSSATEMDKGKWKEVKSDLSTYQDVYVRIYYNGSSAVRAIDDVLLSYYENTDPSINANNVKISANATSGEIVYEITNPVGETELTAEKTTGDWISDVTVDKTNSKVTFKATANTSIDSREAKITLKYEGAKDKVVTITQAGAPYTKIEDIFAKAINVGTTATDVTVTFGDWVVTGVKGSSVYVTDGTNGLIIYASGHGFETCDIISGTVDCKVQLFKGSAEITTVTAETEGITVTAGGEVTPQVVSIADLSGVKTGAVVTLKNVTYNNGTFSDGTNNITPYDTFMDLPTFTTGKKYNITGVYIQYEEKKEIAPRTSDDIEEAAATKYVITVVPSTHGNISASLDEASEGTEITLTATPDAGYKLSEWNVYKTGDEEITVEVKDNKFIMPAYEVTVSATFAEKQNLTVTINIAGDESKIQVLEGDKANLPTVKDKGDWKFYGWTENSTFTEGQTSPKMFNVETPIITNTALFAVFNKTIGGDVKEYQRVTASIDDWRGKYLIASNDTTFMDGSLQGGTDGVGKSQTHVKPGDALSKDETTVTAEWGNEHFVEIEAIDDDDLSKGYVIKSHSETKPYFYQTSNSNGMSASANKETAADYPISIVVNSKEDISIALGGKAVGAVLRYNSNKGTTGEMFRFYKDGGISQKPIYLYKYVDNSITTYATTITEATMAIGTAKWATFIAPFDVEIPEDIKAYTVTIEGEQINYTEVENNTIEACTPVVVFKDVTEREDFTFIGANKATEDTYQVGNLVGTLKVLPPGQVPTEVDGAPVYLLQNHEGKVGFYKTIVGETYTMQANRAYLIGNATIAGKAFFSIDGSDTTGINEIYNSRDNMKREGIFDLSGRKLTAPQKGINIINGVRVLIK